MKRSFKKHRGGRRYGGKNGYQRRRGKTKRLSKYITIPRGGIRL